MKIYRYSQPPSKALILLDGKINGRGPFTFMLDTGATHTTLDYNALAVLGYTFRKPLKQVKLETANGITTAEIFEMSSGMVLGINRKDFLVQVIDFIKQGITSEYDGILGLDFLQGTHFCIDTLHNEIIIH